MRVALLLLLVACTEPRSPACKDVCKREAKCVDELGDKIPFDEKECIAACAVLEGDPDNLAKVQKHAECVAKHTACNEVLDCQ